MASRGRVLASLLTTKLIVGITGLLLFLYLILHIAGNLMVFLGQDVFNRYSYALISNPLVVPVEIGLLIVSVEPETPASSAGLVLGDTVLALDGEKVGHIEELMALLTGDRVGKQVSARILRGGEVRDMKVTIGERNS